MASDTIPTVCGDLEVSRLLDQLRQYQPQSENPAAEVKQVWTELHLAWWRASASLVSSTSVTSGVSASHSAPNTESTSTSVSSPEPTPISGSGPTPGSASASASTAAVSSTSPVANLSWPQWIQLQSNPAAIDLFLHWVYDEDWVTIGDGTASKDNPYPRIRTIAERLGLGGRGGTPWLLFLHFDIEILSSVRTMKELSAWLGRYRSVSPEDILSKVNENALRRHGLENVDTAPSVLKVDLRAALEVLRMREESSPTDSGFGRSRASVTPCPTSRLDHTRPPSPMPVPKRPRRMQQDSLRYDGTPSAGVTTLRFHETSPELGRRNIETPPIDPDLSSDLGWRPPTATREVTSQSSRSQANISRTRRSQSQHGENQDHIQTLLSLRRLGSGPFEDANLRAVTDSIFHLARVALRMMGQDARDY